MRQSGWIGVSEKYRVKVLNHISANGLRRLPWDRFATSAEVEEPHAILLRSADLHATDIPASVLAIGRAGTGTNNIPVTAMSARGVPVFNAPGANANAVKELVLAGMLLAARNLDDALRFVSALDVSDPELEARIESGKKAYAVVRTVRSHARGDRPGQDRLPGGRRGDQAGHARDRLRPGDHRRLRGACPRR